MSRANPSFKVFLILLFVLAVCMHNSHVAAFGAGNIPSFAYLEGKAFRHGDIEDTLGELVKKHGGGMAVLGSLIGKGGSKFNNLDVKRVYFGNWLRDYSQAVDVAGLKKLQLQTIINLCIALGFLAHGYATAEFEVTEARLGCYLPTEHIDNPKGYGEGEDPRKYDKRLRGPVDPQELEVDPRTGMKNYIANENGGWDTSRALVRRTLEQCIQRGRAQRANGQKADEYEAYRLLGQALHTLEDFTAHSNFCELALWSMGYTEVFLHVGDQVRIQAPGGKWVAPLVTGTFGSSDFIHSLLGEATDHISQASVTDLNAELNKAKAKVSTGGTRGPGDNSESTFSLLQDLASAMPSGGESDMKSDLQEMEKIRAEGGSMNGKPPEQLSPQEMHAKLWAILTIRDRIVKKIEKTIERIPGLGPLIERLMENISVFVFTTLEPLLKPLMKSATSGLMAASGEVIDSHDQYEVFNIPTASDPTHSFLSKDHFNLLLNEPAGNLAKIVATHAVNLVVRAWDDPNMNVRNVTEEILEAFFHPDFHNTRSQVQRDMMKYIYGWINGLGERKKSTLQRLRKESVRDHKNIRLTGEGGVGGGEGSTGQSYGYQAQATLQGYVQNIAGGDGSGGGHHSSHHSSHSSSHSSPFAPSYGSGGGGGFPNIPGIPGQLPGLFGGSGFGKREAPEDVPPQPSPYASSYAPTMPSYGDGSDRTIPPEPLPVQRQPSPYAPSYAPSHASNHPEPSREGYQPSYDQPLRQFGYSGGTGGYGNAGGGLGYSAPPEPEPQDDEASSNSWQEDRQFGYPQDGDSSGAPTFPNPQQGFGF